MRLGAFHMHKSTVRIFCLLLALLMCASHPRADEQGATRLSANAVSDPKQPSMEAPRRHLSVDSAIRDVIAHPAFAGFGRLIFPWDDRTPAPSMHLREVGSLLPYHSKVNPDDVVSGLNRMIDDASDGRKIFYDFYTEAQKKTEPTKRNAGLFFFSRKTWRSFRHRLPGWRIRLRRFTA